MLAGLLRWRDPPEKHVAIDLYWRAVEGARNPLFYQEYGVPDTVDGRFDLSVLNTSMIMHRLETYMETDEGKAAKIGQSLFDVFFQDMEQCLREQGVGDAGLPKHMRRMIEGFHGRHMRYRRAFLEEKGAELENAISTNIFSLGGAQAQANIEVITSYTRSMLKMLALCSDEKIRIAQFAFTIEKG